MERPERERRGDNTDMPGHAEVLEAPGQSEGGISMEEHGKLWAIATLLFVIAIIGYVLQD